MRVRSLARVPSRQAELRKISKARLSRVSSIDANANQRPDPRHGPRRTSFKRSFEPALTRAKLRKIRFHDLRHTYASILINQGANLKFVSKQLGHSSIQITLDRYSHLIPEDHLGSIEHFETVVLATGNQPSAKPVGEAHPNS